MKNHKRLIIIAILIFALFSFGITYSVFLSNANLVTTDQNIAKFVVNTENLDSLQLPLFDLIPGDGEDYFFSIKNNANGNVSEVSVEYQIIIKTYHLIPLEIDLYRITGETEEFVYRCDESYNRNDENELVCNAPLQLMPYTKESIDNYKLKVYFPINYTDMSYADLVDYINVEIKSWQK